MRYVLHPFITTKPCQSKLTLTYSVGQALDRPKLSPRTRESCLQSLYRICSHRALLPTSLKVPVSFERTGDALYRGGYADVWRGDHCGRDVAVKVIRIYSDSDLQRVIGVSCWPRSALSCLCTNNALYRGSVRRLSRGRPSDIRTSCR